MVLLITSKQTDTNTAKLRANFQKFHYEHAKNPLMQHVSWMRKAHNKPLSFYWSSSQEDVDLNREAFQHFLTFASLSSVRPKWTEKLVSKGEWRFNTSPPPSNILPKWKEKGSYTRRQFALGTFLSRTRSLQNSLPHMLQPITSLRPASSLL